MQIGKIGGTNLYQQYLQNAARTTEARAAQGKGKTGEAARTDTAVFSIKPQKVQGNGLLQGLMNQKQNLIEKKQALMKEAKSGGASVKEQLDAINEQLQQLEEQISQQMLTEAMRQDGTEKKKEQDDAPKTEDEAEAERTGALTKMAADLSTAEVVTSVQRKAAAQARILSAQTAQDALIGADGAVKAELEAAAEKMRLREAEAANPAPLKPEAKIMPDVPDAGMAGTVAAGAAVSAAPENAPAPSGNGVQTRPAQEPESESKAASQAHWEAAQARRSALAAGVSPLAQSEKKAQQLAGEQAKAADLINVAVGKLKDIMDEQDEQQEKSVQQQEDAEQDTQNN